MAPPINRRTGFSKRAQYSVFFGYLAGIVGLIVGLSLLLISLNTHGAYAGLRGLAADSTAPIGRLFASGRNQSRNFFATFGGYFVSGSQNAQLKQEVLLARVRLAEAEDIRAENIRLKALLNIPRDAGSRPVANGLLIGSTPGSIRRFATLSVGANAGVETGMPVRSPMGLVGRVLDVSATTARVLLITDSESMVPVRRAKDGVDAFAQGHGDGTLVLKLINLGLNPLKIGDVMVTSGAGGLYQPGIAVAVVTQITHDGAVARVLSDPSASAYVEVDQPFSSLVKIPAPETAPSPAPSGQRKP
jgi:rod shape-determining protein MreC